MVGLGAAGSATLLALASRGVRCIGIDRFDPPHNLGSSHGASRLIRLCYFEHPDYVPLLRRSYELWKELQAGAGGPIFRETGGLYIGTPESPFVAGSLASARTHGLRHELLEPRESLARYPQLPIHPDEVAFFEPTTGVLFPENAVAESLRRARSLGALTLVNEEVISWEAGSGGIHVRSSTRSLRGRSLVICAGAWMPWLVPELGSALSVTRQVLAWFRPRDPQALYSPRMPAWAISRPDGSAHYGFPMLAPESAGPAPGGPGFKVALHKAGEPATPLTLDRAARPAELEELAQFLRERIPAAIHDPAEVLHSAVCMYTNTADGHFLLDRHPKHANVVVVSACSGHGFKFAPVLGEAAADLATRGSTGLPVAFLGWRHRTQGDHRA